MESKFNRRAFLSTMAAIGAAGAAGGLRADESAPASQAPEAKAEKETWAKANGYGNFPAPVASYPVLQNPRPHGMTVAWAVHPEDGKLASGWVEWGTTEKLGNSSRSATFGLNQLNANFLSAKMTGLKPSTTYFYRTATCEILFKDAYRITSGDPIYSETYFFKTPGGKASETETSFVVINDTHEVQPTLEALANRITELNPARIVWNGDLLNSYNTPEQLLKSVFIPQFGPIAATRPLVFNNGNHDHRGIWAREKSVGLIPWGHEKSGFGDLGRNFVVRTGPLAIIGLDTGEDKPDANPVFAGLAQFEPYRERQRDWLAHILKSKMVRTAPFVVAFCHIPLFDSNPNGNPGDILDGFASWQRPAAQMWGPLFDEAGVQLLVAAHEHAYRYDEPSPERTWAQLVGGGPELDKNTTIIYGRVEGGILRVVAEKVSDHSVLGTWEYGPRKI